MRYVLSTLALLGLSGPAFAGHLAYNPPGQAAQLENQAAQPGDEEEANGKDYAPGQLAKEYPNVERSGDGMTNGRDFAPGQNPNR